MICVFGAFFRNLGTVIDDEDFSKRSFTLFSNSFGIKIATAHAGRDGICFEPIVVEDSVRYFRAPLAQFDLSEGLACDQNEENKRKFHGGIVSGIGEREGCFVKLSGKLSRLP